MNIREAIQIGLKNIENIDDKYFKVMTLLSNTLNVQKEYLISHDKEELTNEQEREFLIKINKLKQNEPLQYITGKQFFFGMEFKVNENVLIPRFDTEVLVQSVIDYCKEKKPNGELKILDLCTGSGIIGIALAKNIEKSKVYVSDISYKALEIAKENANKNNVNITCIESNLFEKINENEFDIIVSNPPYIERNIIPTLDEEVKKEPIIALDGGNSGLDFYENISKEAKRYLKSNGCIFFEIGYNQRVAVTEILKKNGFIKIECIKDLNGLDRVIKGE